MIDTLWKNCLNQERFDKAAIASCKSDSNLKEAIKAHFLSLNLKKYGVDQDAEDVWILYNWFISTVFGIGIKML